MFLSNRTLLLATFSDFNAKIIVILRFCLIYFGIFPPYYQVFFQLFGPIIIVISQPHFLFKFNLLERGGWNGDLVKEIDDDFARNLGCLAQKHNNLPNISNISLENLKHFTPNLE